MMAILSSVNECEWCDSQLVKKVERRENLESFLVCLEFKRICLETNYNVHIFHKSKSA